MATATFTWTNWDATNAWENLADAGNSASLTYARNATDVAADFTFATKGSTQTEFARKAGTGDTWASIFGIGASDTVTQIQITAWTKKLVTATKLTSHSVTMGFIDDAGSRVTASDSISGVALGTTTDASYAAQSAGSAVAVNAGSQAGSTSVRFSLEYTVTTGTGGGSASVDQRFDGITATITYTPAVTNVGKSDSESAALTEIMPGPELGVTQASLAMEAIAQTDFTVVALGSLAESAGFTTPASDAATASESSTIAVGPAGNDSATLAEASSQTATVAAADTGALAEAASIAATLSDSDSAILPPGQVNEGDLPRDADAGTLVESATVPATLTAADSGSLADSPALAVAATDTGTLAESSSVSVGSTNVNKSDTDTAAGAESQAIALSATDTATQADVSLIAVPVAGADTGTLAETSAIVQEGTHPADTDTAALADTGVVTAQALVDAESGALAEAGTAQTTKLFLADSDVAGMTETGAVQATTTTPTDTESAALAEAVTLTQANVGVSAPPSNIGGGGFGAILRRIKERDKDDDLEVVWAELLPQQKREPAATADADAQIEAQAGEAPLLPSRLYPRVRVRRRQAPMAFELAGTSWAPDDDLARQVAEDQDLVALLALV